MKHFIKKFTLLSYFCLATFLYYSCTQEKEYINEKNRINFDLKEKSLKEALDMPIFSNAYSKLTKKKFSSSASETARTALEDQFGFTIVPDVPVKIISKPDGTVFFTLLIEREVKEELKFENLMIRVKNGETTAAIIKYLMNEKAVKIEEHNSYKMTINEKEFTDLNIDGRTFFVGNCVDTATLYCNDTSDGSPPNHHASSFCITHSNNLFVVWSTTCGGGNSDPGNISIGNTSGGGLNPPTGSGNTNGGGGFPDDAVNIISLPCHTGNCMEVNDDPCDDLANHVDPAKGNIKPSIDWLKDNLNNSFLNKFEFGVNFMKFQNPDETYYYTNELVSDLNHGSVQLNSSSKGVGGGHNHPITGDSMFSFGDFELILDMFETAWVSRKSEVVLILVCRDPNPVLAALGVVNTYALKVNDIVKLKAAILSKKNSDKFIGFTDEKEKDRAINDEMAKIYGTSVNKEKLFLQYFGNYGLDLYKANDALTNWNKLDLETNSGSLIVKQTPCIN